MLKSPQKIGYILFWLSFITPSLGLDYIGVNLAIDCVIGGVSGLLDNLWRIPLSLYGLSLFFLNFSLIPGAIIKKAWRVLFVFWPWSAALIPQSPPEAGIHILAMEPPFVLWALSISLINYSKSKEQATPPEMPPEIDASNENEKPWAHFGDYGENEEFIVGNKEGLRKFRNAIDQAIDSGESLIPEDYTDIAGIKVVAKRNEEVPSTAKEKIVFCGCAAFVLICVIGFVYWILRFSQLLLAE